MKHSCCILLCNLVFIASNAQLKTAGAGHYVFPEFSQGIILLKTGKIDFKLLNYNSLAEQLVFNDYGKVLAVPQEQLGRIDTVVLKERKFVILNNKFVELLHHSEWSLYMEYKCNLAEQGKNAGYGGTSQTSAINTPSAIQLGGRVYDLTLPDGFETKPYTLYWLKKGGEAEQFVSMKQLKKLYKDKSDLFNDYVKKHDVKYEDHQAVIHLIQHLEAH